MGKLRYTSPFDPRLVAKGIARAPWIATTPLARIYRAAYISYWDVLHHIFGMADKLIPVEWPLQHLDVAA